MKWLTAAGVAACVVVVLLVVRAVSETQRGGAATPEGVVTHLTTALNAEDYLSAVSYLPPDERDGVADLIKASQHAARRSGIAEPSLRLDALPNGVETLSPTVSAVALNWSGSANLTANEGLLAQLLGGASFATEKTSDQVSEQLGFSPRLIVIKQGGRWYADPLLTAGDILTHRYGLAAGDYSAADEVAGASASGLETADEAINAIVQALNARSLISAAPALASAEARFARVFGTAIDGLLERYNAPELVDADAEFADVGSKSVELREGRIGVTRDETTWAVGPNCHGCDADGDYSPCLWDNDHSRCLGDVDHSAIAGVLGRAGLQVFFTRDHGIRVDLIKSLAAFLQRATGLVTRRNALAFVSAMRPSAVVDSTPIRRAQLGQVSVARLARDPFAVYEVTARDPFSVDTTAGNMATFFFSPTEGWTPLSSFAYAGTGTPLAALEHPTAPALYENEIYPVGATKFRFVLTACSWGSYDLTYYERPNLSAAVGGCWAPFSSVRLGFVTQPIRFSALPLPGHVSLQVRPSQTIVADVTAPTTGTLCAEWPLQQDLFLSVTAADSPDDPSQSGNCPNPPKGLNSEGGWQLTAGSRYVIRAARSRDYGSTNPHTAFHGKIDLSLQMHP